MRNRISLDLKIWKLYKKKSQQKNFNKENFNKLIKQLELKYNKENEKTRKFYVIKEYKLDGFKKPLHMMATSLGFENEYVWSTLGGVGRYEDFVNNNLIVHKGIYTVEDLEYNYKVLNEHKKWLQEKEGNIKEL